MKGLKMRERLLNATTTFMLVLTFGMFGTTGIALAGEDDNTTPPPPPPPAEPAPPPPTPQPVPVTPAPLPTPPPAPIPPAPKKAKVKKPAVKTTTKSSNKSVSSSPSPSPSITPVANTSVDTGVVPQGGIQAGAGGTAANGSSSLPLALTLGLAAFGVTSGGVALRRRSAER
jgi:outer membrane biosynthesis protein TonB